MLYWPASLVFGASGEDAALVILRQLGWLAVLGGLVPCRQRRAPARPAGGRVRSCAPPSSISPAWFAST